MDGLLRYNILKEIDSGGMATVYLAEDTALHRRVALKKVHPHLLNRPETIKRFQTEAQAVATLSHENIVKVFDCGEQGNGRYLVMEYIEGVTLSELIGKYAPMPNLVLLELMSQILAGLAAAHENGVCHRDIKPSNIMIDRYGCIRIMDFGIAYLVSNESITLTGTFVGSPNYISPEQAEGGPVSGKTDIFSLGSLAYQCATGQLPFYAENPHAIIRGIVIDQPVAPSKRNSRLLYPVSDFIMKCLTKDQRERPDAVECLAKVEALCGEDHLEIGRRRLVRFLEEPVRYREEEERELSGIYSRKAREEFKRHRVVSALKKINQAKALGSLSAGDEKWAASLGRRARRWRMVLAAGLIPAILCLGIGAVLGIRGALKSTSGSMDQPAKAAIMQSDADIQFINSPTVPTNNSSNAVPTKSFGNKTEPRRSDPLHAAEREQYSRRPPLAHEARKQSEKGYLMVRTKPSWVTIVIDGIRAGNTAKTSLIPLRPGRHHLVLSKKGFVDYSDHISVTAGDTVYQRIRMKSAPALIDTIHE
ncbi:MAG: protein kinase [Chitinivibrionales bacterium]|nr:protein kinase [Chitinivibrionales bacterium]MBD3357325.1 protein kinase [Chitinivibrionales bacterium]